MVSMLTISCFIKVMIVQKLNLFIAVLPEVLIYAICGRLM